jgi:hypothetical protein
MSDALIYDLSSQTEGAPTVFVRKDFLSLIDNQNGSYSGNQSVIDTSQLSNSNRYMSYANAYLQIPMIMTLTSDAVGAGFAPVTAATSADYALGLKNWFGSIIHSIQAEWNGVTIIQQTNFQGLYNTFKLMTTLSYNDILTQGSEIGFYPDDALAVVFSTGVVAGAASTNGVGTCFTQNAMTVPPVTAVHSTYNTGNIGFFKRQQYINYDPDGFTAVTGGASSQFSALLAAAGCNTAFKSYIFNKVNGTGAVRGVCQWAINGIVRLKHLHHLFEKMPLLKGVYLKITLQLNNCSVNISSDGAATPAMNILSVSSNVGGVVPIQIASGAAANGSAAVFGIANNFTVSLSVGATTLLSSQIIANVNTSPLGRNITLNVPSFVFAPAFESAYLASQVKTIDYEDIYQYQVLNVTAGSQFNNLITNGIANISKVLVLPYFTTASNNGVNPLYSPFDAAGTGVTSPLCLLTNFQVVVSGQNAL